MSNERALSRRQEALKRSMDVAVSAVLLLATSPVLVLAIVLATLDTRQPGLFRQARIGRGGETFELLKIRTMRDSAEFTTTVTTRDDARITTLGATFRKLKVDELPQIFNVLRGDMSLVGPRPDVAGFADQLQGDARRLLLVRPGITGPASLAYRHEEALLAGVPDPDTYNRDVIWPDKVSINLDYIDNYSLATDLRCLRDTFRSVLAKG